jgi:hypothetical protein
MSATPVGRILTSGEVARLSLVSTEKQVGEAQSCHIAQILRIALWMKESGQINRTDYNFPRIMRLLTTSVMQFSSVLAY